jgi:quinol monooxygenase YgiN
MSSTEAKGKASSGISLHVSITIDKSNVDKFFEAFKSIFEVVTAEPRCLFFEVYQSSEDPGKISWVEDW